jgi:hypothetical protein
MHEHILGPIIPIKELPLYVLMFIQVYTIPNSISKFKSNCIQFATTTRPINPYGSQLALIPSNDRLKLDASMNINSLATAHIALSLV